MNRNIGAKIIFFTSLSIILIHFGMESENISIQCFGVLGLITSFCWGFTKLISFDVD